MYTGYSQFLHSNIFKRPHNKKKECPWTVSSLEIIMKLQNLKATRKQIYNMACKNIFS